MTRLKTTRRLFLGTSAAALGVAGLTLSGAGRAFGQGLKGGTLRVAVTNDVASFDPMKFSTVNFFLIKNLYDSLIEYSETGEPLPSLATEWQIAPDNLSVTVKLREGVTYQSGTPFNAETLLPTLEKGANPEKGFNVFATMAIVKDWEAVDATTVRINFKNPVPDRQILDLLQFVVPIDPAGIETVDTAPCGTGPFVMTDRKVGQSITVERNANYWREGEPILDGIVFTVFSDDASAAAALESGAVDVLYGGQSRSAVRLRDAGYQVLQGPGKLVQVFRINSTRPPFDNKSFRQAFNFLMNRDAILRIGYAGLGEVTALPWAPASPAFDAAYTAEYAYNLDKAKELLSASGLTPAQMSDWKILTNGSDEASVAISQIVQATLAEVGINVDLDVKQGSEYIDALLGGDFWTTFGGVGNVQKFPSRVATNSIYRTSNNPVLGEPHPHPAYVEAIRKVDTSFGEDVQPAYDNLNKVMIDEAFAIPTNSYETGLIVASPQVGGFTLDIDNLFVGRTIGFK